MPDAPADTAPDAAAAAPPRRSPLHAVHEAAGASFTDFAGWLMPVRYTSDLAEHRAVREAAGIFDISHMAEIAVEGEGAAAFLDSVLAGKLSAIAEWQAKYTILLDPSGGIVDDLIVYRTGEESFLVVANAGNHDPVLAVLAEAAAGRDDVEVDDASDDVALIAVQGPVSRAILEATAGLETETPLEALRYYRATAARFAGQDVLVARTGYTGEDGYELYVATEDAVALWEALVAAGTPLGLLNTGLACRDTLRLEAGMPLYGHELGLHTLPVQAGLGKVVALGKEGDFRGRAAVEKGPGPVARVLVGLVTEGRRAPRADYPVYAEEAAGDSAAALEAAMEATEGAVAPVGIVTSGALSPTLGHPVAMAYVDPSLAAPGTRLAVDVRGTRVPATVVTLPFYSRKALA
ncbi:glycine cleavage system aminomethyltransferase GcvT [Clavibacter michiganensis subsp. michiganensis]|uniref:glycine cleavage system aminomethyltransferase GcvT n=1 Tax=Clavibacter michiganensis TaxID=28447 RepID=UPI001365C9F3|nr:glycine cleavage system aminomethyltransferase GcvT [Clavibacter michiganensis]MWJ88579.1 glycine cleavage system aminomethyltransferase GcvT [Clavibacter michiganensis subsp. michiganensis]